MAMGSSIAQFYSHTVQGGAVTSDLRVGNKYRIDRRIGISSSGGIYEGTDVDSSEKIAIKLESVKAEHPQLKYEYSVYKCLAGGAGIPLVRWFGTEFGYDAMVLDLLGPSLGELFVRCKKKFSLKTVLLLFDQIIPCIKYIHAKSFLHGNIEPHNFLMGIGKDGNQVKIIDFGLAKKYRDPDNQSHEDLTGTANDASINTHLSVEQSCSDDMDSLGRLMIYFLRGHLPWKGLDANKKEEYDLIMDEMKKTTVEDLCSGLPGEFATYLNYTRFLEFKDNPDYDYLQKIFRDLYANKGFENDNVFDWIVRKDEMNVIHKATVSLSIQGGPE
ncbi:hypothetical protein VE03_10326 [Pseudogymnoascus sp. 23342-1-I1]|nr:hypothetical protein VE03_10326 [Pseudogymnoascus sp. 23342-1-I1]